MRHPLVPALLVVLALLGYAILGSMAVGAVTPSSNAAVTGTVTDEDGRTAGEAYVLVEPVDGDLLAEHLDGDRVIVESVLKLAQTDPDGVTVVRTDDDGSFSASVPEGRYRIVAVTEEWMSGVREVDATNGVTVDLVADRYQILQVDAETIGPVAPGNTTTVTVRIENADDEAVRSLSITIGRLPAGWTLANVHPSDDYDADARRLTREQVQPGETATVTLGVHVPGDAARGHYEIPLEADSDSHFVEDFDEGTVVVRPVNATATPTTLPAGTDGNASTSTPAPNVDRSLPVPGFGVGAALGGLAVVLALAARRW